MGEDSDNEEETNSYNQNENNDQNKGEEMDTNDIHEILHDPHKLHIPNTNHKPSIQKEENQIETENSNESIDDEQHNISDLFENTEEEIIFNDDEIDEDELDENNNNENITILDQHDDLNPDEENLINQEPNEDYPNMNQINK